MLTSTSNAYTDACDCPSCSDGPGARESLQACPTPCPCRENAPAARTGDVAGCPGQACDACERSDCDSEACQDFPGGPESEVP